MSNFGTLSSLERARHAVESLTEDKISLEVYKSLVAILEALEVIAMSSMGSNMMSFADVVKLAGKNEKKLEDPAKPEDKKDQHGQYL